MIVTLYNVLLCLCCVLCGVGLLMRVQVCYLLEIDNRHQVVASAVVKASVRRWWCQLADALHSARLHPAHAQQTERGWPALRIETQKRVQDDARVECQIERAGHVEL